MMLLLQASFRC